AILENHKHIRIAEHSLRADPLYARSGEQSRDDRVGHLVLDHVRRLARPGRVDDDLHVADIGQRIKRHPSHGPDTARDQQDCPCKHNELIAAAPLDDAGDHYIPPVAFTLSCSAAMVWPFLVAITATCQVPPEPSCSGPE